MDDFSIGYGEEPKEYREDWGDETPVCTQKQHDEAEWEGDAPCDFCGQPRQLPVR